MSTPPSTGTRIWSVCCSLKLAIIVASLITLLASYGSLVMHATPELFGNLDQHALRYWLRHLPSGHWMRTWWFELTGILLVIFGLNTLCCLIEWVRHFRSRWRKSGEYLIHLGFVLLLVGFTWGGCSGTRDDGVQVFLHERFPLPGLPGLDLIVDAVEPVLNQQGRPLDIVNRIRLLQGDRLLESGVLSLNHPLLHGDLVVIPVSFGQEVEGFDCFMPEIGNIRLTQGTTLSLDGGKTLRVLAFQANAGSTRQNPGAPDVRSHNPALFLELAGPGIVTWRGWYYLREHLPYQLLANGIRFWPVNPVISDFSVLTINHDPGAKVALYGGVAMLVGTLLAMISFYRKRRSNDRPEI